MPHYFLCTAKLRKELEIKDKDLLTPDAGVSNLSLWYANLIRIGSKKCLVFVHPETRYTIVALDRNRSEIKKTGQIFNKLFTEILRLEGVEEEIIQNLPLNTDNPQIGKTVDKSVIGTMTDMGRHVRYRVERIGLIDRQHELSLSRELNHIPILSLGEDCLPYQRMSQHLKEHYGFKGEFLKKDWLFRAADELVEEELPEKVSIFRAEKLWRSIPKNIQAKILENVWCGACLTGTKMANWKLGITNNLITLKGQCAICHNQCVRVLED